MTRILMVCLGNICRSPLAEGIMKSKVKGKEIFVDSAGTSSYHIGEHPDPRSIAIAHQNQIDISQQRARQFTSTDFDNFDTIFVMDQSNFKNVVKLARNVDDISKVQLILEVLEQDITDVPDPYYGGNKGFENVFNMLDEACNSVLESWDLQ